MRSRGALAETPCDQQTKWRAFHFRYYQASEGLVVKASTTRNGDHHFESEVFAEKSLACFMVLKYHEGASLGRVLGTALVPSS